MLNQSVPAFLTEPPFPVNVVSRSLHKKVRLEIEGSAPSSPWTPRKNYCTSPEPASTRPSTSLPVQCVSPPEAHTRACWSAHRRLVHMECESAAPQREASVSASRIAFIEALRWRAGDWCCEALTACSGGCRTQMLVREVNRLRSVLAHPRLQASSGPAV
jgi:hypothetical protein